MHVDRSFEAALETYHPRVDDRHCVCSISAAKSNETIVYLSQYTRERADPHTLNSTNGV